FEHLEHVKRANPHTRAGYRRDLEQLHAWLVENKLPGAKDLRRLDLFSLRDFLTSRHKANSTTTVLHKLSAIHTFLRWTMKQKRIPSSPTDALDSPKHPKNLPHTISVNKTFTLYETP